ncbi:MAG: hypothetical protein HQK54_15845, partial [Oligoflexales bacterium]|nr:hypothetical protein [Oligoflexales bacterium]
SVAVYDWMTPYAMYSLTTSGREMGEIPAKMAIEILKGVKPKDIPIIPNREWEIFFNETLFKKIGFNLPRELRNRMKKDSIVTIAH